MGKLEDSADDAKKLNEELNNVAETASFTENALRSIATAFQVAMEDVLDSMENIDEVNKRVAKSYERDIVNGIKKLGPSLDKTISLQVKLNKGIDISKELKEESLKLEVQNIVLQKRINRLRDEGVDTSELQEQLERSILKATEGIAEQQKEIGDVLNQQNEQYKETNELLGLTGQALGAASGILDKIGIKIGSDKFKALEEGARAYANELKEGDENLSDSEIKARVLNKTLVDGAGAFKKEIIAAFNVAVLKGFTDGLKKFFTERENLAKTFALGRDDANTLKTQLNLAANNSGQLHFNIADAVKGIQEFNAEVGLAIKLTAKELETFSLLSNEFGLTNSQAAQFIKSAKLRGKSAKDLTEELRGQIVILAEQEGVAVNQQEVFANIGDISAANRLSMEGQGKSLADAAFQAAKLGMNQQQLEKTANSLLDFESSIAAEMEAELLTGKQLNLEDARRAALMNDQEGLAKAISREIGTAADFGKMNVLQQNALAKAFGMSRDELAETLETQALLTGESKTMTAATEAYNKAMEDGVITAEEQRKIGAEQLTNQLHAEAASKRFQDAMVKLKDKLVPIIEIFAKFLDKLMDGVELLTSMKGILTSIAKFFGVIAGISLFGKVKTGLKLLQKVLSTITGISSTASKLPTSLGGTSTKTAANAAKTTASAGGGAIKSASSPTGFRNAKGQFAKAPTPKGGGMFSGLFSKLNPLNAAKDFLGKNAGKFLKGAAKKIPILGTAIEGIFAASDISGMIAEGGDPKVLNQMVGKRVFEAIGSLGGTVLGGFLGNFIPIPGVGMFLGAMAGDMIGRWVGGALADAVGAEGIGGKIVSMFSSGDTAEDFISRPGQPIQKFRADDVIIGGTNLSGGGDNGEVVTLLKELITAVKQGGDVYIDGAKAGRSLALATSRMG